MNAIEIMKRHLAEPVEYELPDGDKIYLSPLEIGDLPDLTEIQMLFWERGEGDKLDLTKENVAMCAKLIEKSILLGNPEAKEDIIIVKRFIAENFLELIPLILTTNLPVGSRELLKAEKIERLKKNIKSGQSNSRVSGKKEAD